MASIIIRKTTLFMLLGVFACDSDDSGRGTSAGASSGGMPSTASDGAAEEGGTNSDEGDGDQGADGGEAGGDNGDSDGDGDSNADEGNDSNSEDGGNSDSGADGGEAGGEEEGETGASFVDNDAGSVVSCDPWSQDCPDGEKCVPYAAAMPNVWDANKCVPVMGDKGVGDACELPGGITVGEDDCDANTYCFGTGESRYCTAFCQGSADEPICDEGICKILNSGSITLCMPECEPLLQDCPDGEGCYLSDGAFSCFGTSGDIEQGGACGFLNDCSAGNQCLNAELYPDCAGTGCCSPYCETDNDEVCPTIPGTTCIAVFEEGTAPPGQATVGLCQIPGG